MEIPWKIIQIPRETSNRIPKYAPKGEGIKIEICLPQNRKRESNNTVSKVRMSLVEKGIFIFWIPYEMPMPMASTLMEQASSKLKTITTPPVIYYVSRYILES